MTDVRFCDSCGTRLAPGATRCPKCGAALEQTRSGSEQAEAYCDVFGLQGKYLRDRGWPSIVLGQAVA
jgi:predicted RNA-binding Zn-ribbon protein involved in translation (DUF1610 family)